MNLSGDVHQKSIFVVKNARKPFCEYRFPSLGKQSIKETKMETLRKKKSKNVFKEQNFENVPVKQGCHKILRFSA